ncbi:AfsR/SARP family transcriptional regulator [Streptomyces sp. NPDC047097]|uniref:AfsR/SARP family transcriptional regulator n=1 Tax=Streptomyces sp. NPDC047097 TaxID=3155260 RepID=UPI003410C019
MRFNLLGPFELLDDAGESYTPQTPKVCQVLALALTSPNKIVSVESFIQELWGDNPPRSALTTLQTYIYHARKLFAQERFAASERPAIVTRPSGYLVEVDEQLLDVTHFGRLLAQGKQHLDADEPALASTDLHEALRLWRGPALANTTVGAVLSAQVTYLTEVRIRTTELRIEAERLLGRHRELIPELRSLVQEYPFNEWFHGQLIDALSRSGRRAEALQSYQELRRILHSELALEPSPELQQLQQRLLGHPTPMRRERYDVATA